MERCRRSGWSRGVCCKVCYCTITCSTLYHTVGSGPAWRRRAGPVPTVQPYCVSWYRIDSYGISLAGYIPPVGCQVHPYITTIIRSYLRTPEWHAWSVSSFFLLVVFPSTRHVEYSSFLFACPSCIATLTFQVFLASCPSLTPYRLSKFCRVLLSVRCFARETIWAISIALITHYHPITVSFKTLYWFHSPYHPSVAFGCLILF